MRLAGKAAIVTGAGRGIGRCIALAYGQEGVAVAVVDIVSENAERVAREITEAGGRAIAVRADVTNENDVTELVVTTVKSFGAITTLVNSAGVLQKTPFFEMTAQEWRHVIDVNLTGMFLVTLAAGKEIAKAGGGSIINISSLAAERGVFERVAYCASKGGVKAMTFALATTLAPYHIRVNAIAPGPMLTPMNPQLQIDPEAREAAIATIPLGRLGNPVDLTGICIYLASDESSWTTGIHICVDGGYVAAYAPPPRFEKPNN